MKALRAIPALPVAAMERSKDFYGRKLGFDLIYEEDGFAIFACDGIEVHLWAATDVDWQARGVSVERPIVSGAESFLAGTASCRLQIEGIDEFYSECRAQEILHPRGALRDQAYGSREFAVVDPDNNLITFFEPL